MGKEKFDINALTLKPALAITFFGLVGGLLVDAYVFPDRGRIAGFSTAMSLVAVYTATPVVKYLGAKIFILILHIALVALPFTHDSDYGGPLLIPFAIADYVLMVFALRKCTVTSMA